MLMSIHPRAACSFGIVHVNRRETLETDHSIEFTKCFLNTGFAADVVTGGEHVRRVEANAETLGLADVVDDVSDLLKFMAQTGALSGRRFERDFRFHFW